MTEAHYAHTADRFIIMSPCLLRFGGKTSEEAENVLLLAVKRVHPSLPRLVKGEQERKNKSTLLTFLVLGVIRRGRTITRFVLSVCGEMRFV